MASRRSFLLALGGAAVAAAAGGAVWVSTRTPTGALEPWREARLDDADPRLAALSFAVLSANAHNRQPWLLALEEDGDATLYCDLDRLLPVTDPFGRQITIGLGCFLETYRIAAAERGLVAEITPFPDGEDPRALDSRPVARIRHRAGAAPDPLFEAIPRRRTVKEPYAMDAPPSASSLSAIVAAAEEIRAPMRSTAEEERVAAIRDLMWRGHEREATTPAAFQESVDLMRIGRAEIEASPDGIDLGGPFLEALSVAGVLTRETLADPTSQAFAEGMARYEQMLSATPAALWMTTGGNTRADQLLAGRGWARAGLRATQLGLSIHPISQVLQEYPEMADLFAEARTMLGVGAGETVQMLGRVGRPPEAPPSPRWPAASRLRTA